MIADPLAKRVVTRIVEGVHPRQVIVFGSRARGTARPDSDVDVLVIYDGPMPKRELKQRIRKLFPLPDFGMDLFVLTPDEFERQKRVVSTVGRVAAREGVVCHG
jgi:uncharacterized protein